MLALKDLLIVAGLLMMATACGITLYDVWLKIAYQKKLARGAEGLSEPDPVRWRGFIVLVLAGFVPLLLAQTIVVVPVGMGGVRVRPGRRT